MSNYSPTYPAFHAIFVVVQATPQFVATLKQADSPLNSRPPFMATSEPGLLLMAHSLGGLSTRLGDGRMFDSLALGIFVIVR